MSSRDGSSQEKNDRESEAAQLGERLRTVREYLGFSQQWVAERTGVPRSAISDIERGIRRIDSLELKKFARLYRYPVAYFLDDQQDPSAASHAVAALGRVLTDLTEKDREEVRRFAEYLRMRRAFADEEMTS